MAISNSIQVFDPLYSNTNDNKKSNETTGYSTAMTTPQKDTPAVHQGIGTQCFDFPPGMLSPSPSSDGSITGTTVSSSSSFTSDYNFALPPNQHQSEQQLLMVPYYSSPSPTPATPTQNKFALPTDAVAPWSSPTHLAVSSSTSVSSSPTTTPARPTNTPSSAMLGDTATTTTLATRESGYKIRVPRSHNPFGSDDVHPKKKTMKKLRKRRTAAGTVGGMVVGGLVAGPAGVIAGGVAGGIATNKIHKARERKAQRKFEKKNFQEAATKSLVYKSATFA